MPPRKRTPAAALRERFTGQQIDVLLSGHDHFHVFASREEQRQAWELLRDELLPEFIAKNPGHRPWAWWEFDAPKYGRRECDNQQHPFENPDRIERVERIAAEPDTHPDYRENAYRLNFGKPCVWIYFADDGGPDDTTAEYESEFLFLGRHDLLTRTDIVQFDVEAHT